MINEETTEELTSEDKEDQVEEDKEEVQDSKKKILTFFMIFFPSVILSIIPTQINDSNIVSLGIKLCLLMLQFVILKNFIDTYYD